MLGTGVGFLGTPAGHHSARRCAESAGYRIGPAGAATGRSGATMRGPPRTVTSFRAEERGRCQLPCVDADHRAGCRRRRPRLCRAGFGWPSSESADSRWFLEVDPASTVAASRLR